LDTFFPYGRFDFREIRGEQLFFVDNSRYIRQLERAGKALLFFRPHRFGKSLLVSMLEHYYDKRSGNELFDGLDIGTSPTPLARSFHVLKLDFSISINNGIQANFTECELTS
jgi:ABC-type enterochelin transport system ATPase subunit